MEQAARIRSMEQKMDKAAEALRELEQALERYAQALPQLHELSAYYSNGMWREDFDDDCAGRLPKDLKRGVLSEDGLYNLLMEDKRLRVQMGVLAELRTGG